MKNLQENNNPFSSEGVIARLPFFGVTLLNAFVGFTFQICFEVAGKATGVEKNIFIIGAVIIGLLNTWLAINNLVKRVRDIKAEAYKPWHSVLTFFCALIPIVGLVTALSLLFRPGKVTGNNEPASKA